MSDVDLIESVRVLRDEVLDTVEYGDRDPPGSEFFEALLNAFRHARARSVEVEVEYGARSLRLTVRDDGDGIAPEVLSSGRTGHWGLSGMRERARDFGAEFEVRSRAGEGTEVRLSVPGDVAYPSDVGKDGAGRLGRFLPRRWRLSRRRRD